MVVHLEKCITLLLEMFAIVLNEVYRNWFEDEKDDERDGFILPKIHFEIITVIDISLGNNKKSNYKHKSY